MIENSFKFKFSKKYFYFYFGMWPFVITCWLNCRMIVPSPAFNMHWSQVAKTASISIKHVSGLSCYKIVAWGFDYCRSPRHNIEMFTRIYQKNRTRDNENCEIFCKLWKARKKKKRKWNGKYIYMIVTSRMWQCAKALLQLSKFSLSVADLEDYRVAIFCFV